MSCSRGQVGTKRAIYSDMSKMTARKILDTLLDPSTEIDCARIDQVRDLVALCQDSTLDLAIEDDYNAVILDRCEAVIARWNLYPSRYATPAY